MNVIESKPKPKPNNVPQTLVFVHFVLFYNVICIVFTVLLLVGASFFSCADLHAWITDTRSLRGTVRLLNYLLLNATLSRWSGSRGSPFRDSRTRDLMTLTQLKYDSGFMTPLTWLKDDSVTHDSGYMTFWFRLALTIDWCYTHGRPCV